ncbi:MAG: threonine-phosphate decarboxylase [Sulfitobacter sp.]
MQTLHRDHGGNLDAAVARFGGRRDAWLDLSTGINPTPYPVPEIPAASWRDLPDKGANAALIDAARQFWEVPAHMGVLAVPGASAAIAQMPRLAPAGSVSILGPTYNEHAASFTAAGWQISDAAAQASVHVHPNNPDGRLADPATMSGELRIIDESFCDVMPEQSLILLGDTPGTLILKSFGKFWGLAGVRLGFVIGDQALLNRLADMLGPWAVTGPALHIGRIALQDMRWAQETRLRLQADSDRMDQMMTQAGASLVGGTTLFRLYDVKDAQDWQTRLAQHHIWSRIFPYNPRWIRLGLPPGHGWAHLEAALA